MNKVAEFASGAAYVPVEVATRYCPVVAWLNQQTLGCCRLLLLRDDCINCCLGLLLLRSKLGSLHSYNGLLLLEFIFCFDPLDLILGHL